MTIDAQSLVDRSALNPETGCWEWQGPRHNQGYGETSSNGIGRAHRKIYELLNGPIPKGFFVCHRCDNPPCINPEHLYLGTVVDNAIDSVLRKRHRSVKLDPEQVRFIRELYGSGGITMRGVAERFGIHRCTVNDIIHGRTWSYI